MSTQREKQGDLACLFEAATKTFERLDLLSAKAAWCDAKRAFDAQGGACGGQTYSPDLERATERLRILEKGGAGAPEEPEEGLAVKLDRTVASIRSAAQNYARLTAVLEHVDVDGVHAETAVLQLEEIVRGAVIDLLSRSPKS
jgi:hypothetical protein